MKKDHGLWGRNFTLDEIFDPNNGMLVRIVERSYGVWHKEIWIKIKMPSKSWKNGINFYSPTDIQEFVDGLRSFNQLTQDEKDSADLRNKLARNGITGAVELENFWPNSFAKTQAPYFLYLKSTNPFGYSVTSSDTIERLCSVLEDIAAAPSGVVNPNAVQIA